MKEKRARPGARIGTGRPRGSRAGCPVVLLHCKYWNLTAA